MKSAKELLQTMLSKIGVGFSSASVEVLTELVTIQLDEAGTLSKRIGDDKKLAISRMKVIGALDSSDVKCLRNMPQLEELDLLDLDYNYVSAYGHFGKPGLPWEE